MNYDVNTVIIGGGPAGVSCGISLKHNGISCVIIEKNVFPREKLCGGLITEKTYKLIDELFHMGFPKEELPGSVFCDISTVVELHYSDKRLTSSYVKRPFRFVYILLYFAPKTVFTQNLG